jgi:hypothetical protein
VIEPRRKEEEGEEAEYAIREKSEADRLSGSLSEFSLRERERERETVSRGRRKNKLTAGCGSFIEPGRYSVEGLFIF